MSKRSLVVDAPDMTFDQKVIALLMCIAQEKKVEIEQAIEGTVQSFLQLKLLHSLAEAPEGRLTVGQLRSRMVERAANVSRTLNKLSELGLIEKVRSTKDQRTVHVSITEAGRIAHEEGDASLTDLSTGLEAGELKQLFDLLVKL
jgi:MarR family transcriptional regulator, organic hydroperoxide resistance regulator